MILRLSALVLVIFLVWLAQQAGMAGVAGIHGESAAGYRQEMLRNSAHSARWSQALAEGERNIALVGQVTRGVNEYTVLAADFAYQRQQNETAAALLRDALGTAPVRAGIWSRLALVNYQLEGASAATLHALDQAFFFGPREYDTLLVNATITLDPNAKLDARRQLRGWNGIVEAVAMPGLARQVTAMVAEAGMQRQLRTLLRQRQPQREALELRREELRGDG